MRVCPSDLDGHLGDDLVEGGVGGDGSVGGSPEQDEAESSGGAPMSSRDEDATEPSAGLAAIEDVGEGIVGTIELPHELIVGGVAPELVASEALESEDEPLEEGVEVGEVEELVVDVVDPLSVLVGRGRVEMLGSWRTAFPARTGRRVGAMRGRRTEIPLRDLAGAV